MNSRTVQAGPWRVMLHPPVLVYEGTREEHITRANLCRLDGAVAMICQTTFDTSATLCDRKDIFISTDNGASWRVAARPVDIGSYSLISKPNGEAVVMPYDSIRFKDDRSTFTGPRNTLSMRNGSLHISTDT